VRIVTAVVATLGALFAPSVAAAAEDEKITWAVSPATTEGPDGRAWVELSLDPGDTVVEHLAVRNLSDVPATFELLAADGYFTDGGRFTMLPRTTASVGAGLWIEVEPTIEIAPGDTAVVPFTVTVPDNATPGDHVAGIAASVYSVQDADGGTQLGLDSRVGFRVMTRVTGDIAPSVMITAADTDYRTSWNPFAPGDLTVTLDLVNDGNTRLSVSGTVSAAGTVTAFGEPETGERIELLPGDHRTITATLDDVWPTVRVPVDILADIDTATADGDWSPLPDSPVSTSTTAWAVPWPQLTILVGLALIVVAFGFQRRRRHTHLQTMLDKAREEGRNEALTGPREHNR
jgi:hypothetical protein